MPKNPDQAIGAQVPSSQMRGDLAPNRFEQYSGNTGSQTYALGKATVVGVDYEKMEVTLRTEGGEQFERLPIPITFPAAGHRHFLGALPEIGDICVVGWGMYESGRVRQPLILAWVIPGVAAGYDWLPTQPYSPTESGSPPRLRYNLEGALDRHRHKLRHMEPGNIVGSSAQGADLVLNESVLLANRRGNEILLRDQDQALVVRSLQQFHAGAGFRVYSGMVQRDATFLPTQMFSDGFNWASSRQVDAQGNAIPIESIGSNPYPTTFLTPATVFQREEGGTPTNDLMFSSDLDPYDFLQRGLFITPEGCAYDKAHSTAVYGGKHFFRVSTSKSNGVLDTSSPTFTEHRIELSHTADGTLPVTEQTDGFDADRLPGGSPEGTDPLGQSGNAPFLEFVLGTVVGNDPYSQKGRVLYGAPLRPVIFDVDDSNPVLASGWGIPVTEHAAVLLQVRPPVGPLTDPTFITITKDGRIKSSIVGPRTDWSAEVYLAAGMRLGAGVEPTGQSLRADFDGAIIVRTLRGRNDDNMGILLQSDEGAVKVFAGGTSQIGGPSFRSAPSGGGEGTQPGLILESATNTLLKAAGTVVISGNRVTLENASEVSIGANTGLNLMAEGTISVSSNTYVQSSTGKSTYNYSGPKDGNLTNGPLREISFTGSPTTGFAGGTADKYDLLYGDRVETLNAGNHETKVLVGNQTYECLAGILSLKSGASSLRLTAGSIVGRSGSMTLQAVAGSAVIQAATTVLLDGTGIVLNAPAITMTSVTGAHTPQAGGILTDGVIDPLTGRPFRDGGVIGVQTIRVT